MLGRDQPVILQLLETPQALNALKAVVMELDDSIFPLLAGVEASDDVNLAFGDVEYALLVGAMPRKAGMERSDLLAANGGIFKVQGRAIADTAKKNVKVLVVGNPANTNALIALTHARGLDPSQFTAMTRLDHNRAISLLARHLDKPVASVRKMTIWGNHSATQFPDLFHCEIEGKIAAELVNDQTWYAESFIPTVAKRGSAIIQGRGTSSAASGAMAAMDQVCSLALGTPDNDWVSMGIYSDGSDGIPEGIIYSAPCTCQDGQWSRVQGLEINEFSRKRMDASAQELLEERHAVHQLGFL